MFTHRSHRFLASFASFSLIVCCNNPRRPDGGEGLLPAGATAPLVEGTDQDGTIQQVSRQRGRPLVVYFYPKDGTPGCTKEACAFRDVWSLYAKANVQIFAVSTDSVASHQEFAQEHRLPFPLIADPESRWLHAFGVPSKLGMAARVTFLIDPRGKVAKVYPNVDPGVHAQEVLKDAEDLR